MARREDFVRYLKDKMAGKDVSRVEFPGTIKHMPDNFTKWKEDNHGRIEAMKRKGTLPEFLKERESTEADYITDDAFGERLKIHKQADKTELQENIRAARALLSSFPDMNIQIREHVYEKGVKNPEYLINENIADRKGIESEKGVASGFNKAIKQWCSVVVIDLDANMHKINTNRLGTHLFWRKQDFVSGTIEECYVIYNNKTVIITNDNIVEKCKVIETLKQLEQ